MTSLVQRIAVFGTPEPRTTAKLSSFDDITLVDRFLERDDMDAFEALVRRYQDKVFRLALSILGRDAESDAEEVTQDVFITLFRKLGNFRQESAFSTWLYQLARFRIIDARRSLLRTASITHVGEDHLELIPDKSRFSNPEHGTLSGQLSSRMLAHVDQLPETQRTVIHLHYWQEQSVTEIGVLLDLPENTVKSHLFRARHNLARLIGEAASDV